jgi:uncharacterized OB-fold protein
MTESIYSKLVPEPTPDSAAYWKGLNEGKLLLQECARCWRVRHYPRPVCDACHSFETRWVEASGKGAIHSWTITHHPFHDGYRSDLPYTLVTVDLEEGVRMLARLHAPVDTRLDIGMPVRLVFEKAKPGLTLPGFALAAHTSDVSAPPPGER